MYVHSITGDDRLYSFCHQVRRLTVNLLDRTKRVKDARSEAQKEIEDYRKQKENEFKEYEKQVRGTLRY
jgi:hypothetical protein